MLHGGLGISQSCVEAERRLDAGRATISIRAAETFIDNLLINHEYAAVTRLFLFPYFHLHGVMFSV